jgi:hypothetical protein
MSKQVCRDTRHGSFGYATALPPSTRSFVVALGLPAKTHQGAALAYRKRAAEETSGAAPRVKS